MIAREKNDVSCGNTPISWCLWICEGCTEFLKKIREEQEKKGIKEEKKEVETLINEEGLLGKWIFEM